MPSGQHATVAPSYPLPRIGVAGRSLRWALAAIVAVALAALSSTYFAVNAGTDYPEPWAQAGR